MTRSGRKRLGVVLLVPPPVCVEIDGLRRACDDGALDAIAPHLTLVPPVNVRGADVGTALAVVRAAATATRPFTVTLGPPATFAPVSPVLYLSVDADDGSAAVTALRDAVFVPPLARRLTYPFVPHVTVADEMVDARLTAAVDALAGYRQTVTFDRVHVMEEVGRAWQPLAEAPFGPPAVVARGPLEVRLEVTTTAGPEARALASREWPLVAGMPERSPLVVTAWRGGDVVGLADGWTAGALGWLDAVIVASAVRREGIGSHLLAAFESACVSRGATSLSLRAVEGSPGAGLARRRGWREAAGLGAGRVLLRRDV